MEGKANFNLSNMNDDEKEAGTLSYTIKNVESLEEAQKLKDMIDQIVVEAGGDIHENALKIAKDSKEEEPQKPKSK